MQWIGDRVEITAEWMIDVNQSTDACHSFIVAVLSTSKAGAAPSAPVNPIFRDVVPQLVEKTQVPVKLPFLVVKFEQTERLYASLGSVGKGHYYVSFAHEKLCPVQVCLAGYVSGEVATGSIDTSFSVLVKAVTLANGAHAIIVQQRCGAGCNPPSITWDYREVRYAVSLFTRDEQGLIAMANSMTTYK